MNTLVLFDIEVDPDTVSLEREAINDGVDKHGYLTYRKGRKWIHFQDTDGVHHKRQIDEVPEELMEWMSA